MDKQVYGIDFEVKHEFLRDTETGNRRYKKTVLHKGEVVAEVSFVKKTGFRLSFAYLIPLLTQWDEVFSTDKNGEKTGNVPDYTAYAFKLFGRTWFQVVKFKK